MSKEYIERERLLLEVEDDKPLNWNNDEAENQADSDFDYFIATIKAQPKADVVEVVRCKNCKHFDTDVFRRTVCVRDFQIICVKDNDFCSYGERKDDNGKIKCIELKYKSENDVTKRKLS